MIRGGGWLCAALIAWVPSMARADSPLTSTTFHRAYSDVPMVQRAAADHALTDEVALFLSNPDKPIDEKAAVINALGWKVGGTGFAETYTAFLARKYGRDAEVIRRDFAKVLSPDEIFALGYLQALDDYFHPDKAIPILERAVAAEKNSYTAAMVLALTRGQLQMSESPCDVWTLADEAQRDKRFKKDMRQQGRQMIFQYIGLYRSSCER